MGPDAMPPSDRFVYSVPSARAAGSVHCICGALRTKLRPRLRKLDPELERMLKFPPLKPPREGSYDDVESELDIDASRGRPFAPTCIPLSVTLFWSAPSPRTEKPSGPPSSPGTSSTPGNDAAIAAMSPC